MKIQIERMILASSAVVLLTGSLAAAQTASAPQDAAVPPAKLEIKVTDLPLPPDFVPQGYEEGYLPRLSDIDIREIEQFARNSYEDLKDLLDVSNKMTDYWEKREVLKNGIDSIIQKSKPLKTELLMRNVLERAIIMVKLIELEVGNDLKRKGVIDQVVRLMKESIRTSMKYWEPYLKHVNGQTTQANVDLAKINYRQFGVNYSNLLWSVANSIFDASAEYKLRVEALKLLMWDLYRDENKLETGQAGAISKIYNFLKFAPDSSAWSDDQYVEKTKVLRALRNEVFGRLGTDPAVSPVEIAAKAQAAADAERARAKVREEQAKVEARTRVFRVGETVIVFVRQGRTTAKVARVDADGFIVAQTPQNFDNYEGPSSKVHKYEELSEFNGFRVGEVVTVVVRQGRTTGTISKIFRIDGDVVEAVVGTPQNYDNYGGVISGLIKTQTQ